MHVCKICIREEQITANYLFKSIFLLTTTTHRFNSMICIILDMKDIGSVRNQNSNKI
jgi:hypothetical protein